MTAQGVIWAVFIRPSWWMANSPALMPAMLHGRPAQRMLYHNVLCTDPYSQIGLVWFLPLEANPLAGANDMLGYLVQALDAGQSVMLHAATMAEINAVCGMITRIVGPGGQA